MSGLSKNISKKLLASLFLLKSKPLISPKQEWTKPKNYYIGLSNTEVNEEDTGCSIGEPISENVSFLKALNVEDSTGYKRVVNNYWGFDHVEITVFNSKDIVFPKAKKDWGLINAIVITDEPSSGNILFFKNLDSPLEIEEGKKFYIKSGNLRLSFPKSTS